MILFLLFIAFSFFGILVWRWNRLDYFPGLMLIYGKKGSGKTTYLAYAAKRFSEKRNVYSNVPIKGTYRLPTDFYKYTYPAGSVVLVDEGGIVFNSRSFKSFPKEAIAWFKLQRHLGVMVIMTSQAADVDLILRNLADEIYISRTYAKITVMTAYQRCIVIAQRGKNGDGGSDIVDDYRPKGLLSRCKIAFSWLYWRMFDSWEVPDWLSPVDEKFWTETCKSDVYNLR